MKDYKEMWERYLAVTNWQEAGKHTDYAIYKEGNNVFIFFQGSDEPIDWLRDLMIWPVSFSRSHDVFIHAGFAKEYREFARKESSNILKTLHMQDTIYIIGYSSGAALAVLLARSLWITKSVKVFTFASPKLFWLETPFYPSTKDVINVRIKGDIVPKIFSIFGYSKNPGKNIILPSPYRSPSKNHLPVAYTTAIRKS